MQSTGGATPLMYACQQCKEHEVLDILARNPYAVQERDRTLKTSLHYCAENFNTSCAEAILKAAPELVNAQDENGYCTLHLTVIAGNKAMIELLISKGADVNLHDFEGHSAVHWAIVSSEKEALDMILQAGANPSTSDIHGGYPLHYAVQMCGSNVVNKKRLVDAVRVVQTLIQFGADVNVVDKDGRQPILWAASAGSAKAITHLISNGARVDAADKDGLTALHCAASRGHTDTIETLVTLCGAEVDVIDGNGCSALFYAVTLGHADATEILLNLGAEPNRQDRKGRTPPHCGAAKGQLETLRILKKHGGNLWLRNVKGDLPFHEAVASGRKDLVLWLLDQNPEAVNIGNNDGRCALHIAAMYNYSDMIKVLLDANSLVNPVMRSSKGVLMTPLNVALSKGNRSCGKFLQLHGGVPFSKVSKTDTNVVQTRNSHFNNAISKNDEIRNENVSPSFTVIKATFIDDQFGIDSGEKKKVYRRRKKRRNQSSEREIYREHSDSENSIPEAYEKMHLLKVSKNFKNEGSETEDDENNQNNDESFSEKDGKKRHMLLDNQNKKDIISSKIIIDDCTAENKIKNNKNPDASKENAGKTSEVMYEDGLIIDKLSSAENKKIFSITPEDFPPTMQTVNKLNSVIEEPDTEINKAFDKAEKIDKEIQDSDLEKKSAEIQEDKKNLITNMSTPSFKVLHDKDFEKNESTYPKKKNIKDNEKIETKRYYKEHSVQKSETSSNLIRIKTEKSVRKYEKTTTAAVKKNLKIQPEENLEYDSNLISEKNEKEVNKNSTEESNEKIPLKENYEENLSENLVSKDSGQGPSTETKDSISKSKSVLQKDEIDSSNEVNNDVDKSSEPQVADEKVEEKVLEKEVVENVKIDIGNDKPSEQPFNEKDHEDYNIGNDSKMVQPTIENSDENRANISSSNETTDNLKIIKNNEGELDSEVKAMDKETLINPEISPKKSILENFMNISVPEIEGIEISYGDKSDSVKQENDSLQKKDENLSSEVESTINKDEENTLSNNVATTRTQKNSDSKPENDELEEINSATLEKGLEIMTPVSNIQDPAPEVTQDDTMVAGADNLTLKINFSETLKNDQDQTNQGAIDCVDNVWKDKDDIKPKSNYSGEVSEGQPTENVEVDSAADDTSGKNSPYGDYKSDNNNWVSDDQASPSVPKITRLCRKNKGYRETNQVSVTQVVQGTIRKYHLERGIFHQLLELKRMQIRAGRANEQVLVKRLVDEYEKSCACLGMRHYIGPYNFREFESFLYDQLKALNKNHSMIRQIKSYDDIDALSGILKKSRFKILNEVPAHEPQCSCITQRCHHTIRAYTTLPCSAYVAHSRYNKTNKQKKESFLPRIDNKLFYKPQKEKQHTTLELIKGNEKQVIRLPKCHPDQSKKYYITLIIKSAQAAKDDFFDDISSAKNYFKHRHAKSV